MYQDIKTGIVRKEKTEEEVKVEEEEEEGMIPNLVRGDNQREGEIHLMRKEKATRRETKITGLEMTVQVSQVQTRIDQVSQDQDLILAQRERKTLHQEEKSQKEVEDPTKVDTIKMIEW